MIYSENEFTSKIFSVTPNLAHNKSIKQAILVIDGVAYASIPVY